MRRIIIFIVVTLIAKVVLGYATSISFCSESFHYASESVIVQLVQWGASIMLGGVVSKMKLPI